MKKLLDGFYGRMDAAAARMKDKELRFPVDLTVGILFAAAAAVVLLIMPQQVTISEKDVVNGRVFPSMLMWVMLVCCAGLVIREIVKIVRKQPLEYKTINLLVEVKALIILAILFITYILARETELFVVGAVFCALAFLVYFRCRKPLYYLITVGLAVGIWAAFRFLLNVRF